MIPLEKLNPVFSKKNHETPPVRAVADESFQHVVVEAESFASFLSQLPLKASGLVALGSGPLSSACLSRGFRYDPSIMMLRQETRLLPESPFP